MYWQPHHLSSIATFTSFLLPNKSSSLQPRQAQRFSNLANMSFSVQQMMTPASCWLTVLVPPTSCLNLPIPYVSPHFSLFAQTRQLASTSSSSTSHGLQPRYMMPQICFTLCYDDVSSFVVHVVLTKVWEVCIEHDQSINICTNICWLECILCYCTQKSEVLFTKHHKLQLDTNTQCISYNT